jgi:hypothetical protein
MEELAIKLAEMLEVTVESAMELYPLLRYQYIWYKVLGFVATPFVLVAIASFVVAVYSLLRILDRESSLKLYKGTTGVYSWEREINEAKRVIESNKRNLKLSIITLGATTLLAITLYTVRIIMAPDLHMLLNLMN